MDRNTLIIAVAIIVIVLATGVLYFLMKEEQPITPIVSDQKIRLAQEQDLTFVELTEEEKQALKDQGFDAPPSGEDSKTKSLQLVNTSDEVAAIAADINATDLSGLDAELAEIDKLLSGL